MVVTRQEEERERERLAAMNASGNGNVNSSTGNGNDLTVNTNVNSRNSGDTNTSPLPPSLMPFGKTIDLTTDSGRKYYIDATKELSIKFDGTKQKYHSFILTLKDAATERGWDKICGFYYNGSKFDLLVQPGKITLPDLASYCSSVWCGKNYQVQQLHNIMGVCLLKSVVEKVRNRLDLDKTSWLFKARGGSDGLLILKHLIIYSMQSTRYGIQATKDTWHTMKRSNYENNVTTMLLARRNFIDESAAHGEKFAEDLFWLYKSLLEQGKSTSLSSEELQVAADTRYRH